MHINYTKYTHGDIVYLKTDPDQKPRMVISFSIRPGGVAYYELAAGADSSYHFEIEMSDTKDDNLILGI
ncbi:hypothetical protein [Pedobacter metabolipauper]|uniref:Uncharacterized protein n=1 Tax=Pedobacter metabolipauper TaxID=425513 RepID=A0A4R6T148_9SPHI|nr:hypothetical protein [Pedobacter metabolipauper]TDQ12172.1 hypothetical protein ATK78_1304 [Pedobacter metabolipauper]